VSWRLVNAYAGRLFLQFQNYDYYFFYLNIQVQLFLVSFDVWLVVGLELEGLGFKTTFFYFLVTETLRQK
jgi:hypothetical protein